MIVIVGYLVAEKLMPIPLYQTVSSKFRYQNKLYYLQIKLFHMLYKVLNSELSNICDFGMPPNQHQKNEAV